MGNTNIIPSTSNVEMYFSLNITRLEELPNELFFLMFSYLKSNMVIQTFFDLNQRFQYLILQYTHHLVFSADIESSWINKYMLSIKNNIQTITLSIKLIPSVFFQKYSYPNLRSITLYSDIHWQIELDIENELPAATIVSALNVLQKCSFDGVDQYCSKQLESNHILPCSAIRRVWILECHEKSLWKLCDLAPELTHLKVWLRHSSKFHYWSAITPVRSTRSTCLIELYIKLTDLQSLNDISLLIDYCHGSLKRITFDFGPNLMIDGKKLETLLTPCKFLDNVSFISEISKKQIHISNLLRSFQSKWWLDTQRSPVLIHETDFDYILAMSIPCSFSKILKNIQFSSDLNSWYSNKGNLDSLMNNSIKTKQVYLSGKQPINLDFLQFIGRIFHSRKQALTCKHWGLRSEEELFKQFMTQSNMEIVLPNITRLKIEFINGLSPLTLAIWFLLAPNVQILEIEYLTFDEIMEWIIELNDAFMMHDQRLKMIFQKIYKITISSTCYNYDERSKLKIVTILKKIFSLATIY